MKIDSNTDRSQIAYIKYDERYHNKVLCTTEKIRYRCTFNDKSQEHIFGYPDDIAEYWPTNKIDSFKKKDWYIELSKFLSLINDKTLVVTDSFKRDLEEENRLREESMAETMRKRSDKQSMESL